MGTTRVQMKATNQFPARGICITGKSCIAVLEELAVATSNYYVVKERRMEYCRLTSTEV
jgi:hypothetical protein